MSSKQWPSCYHDRLKYFRFKTLNLTPRQTNQVNQDTNQVNHVKSQENHGKTNQVNQGNNHVNHGKNQGNNHGKKKILSIHYDQSPEQYALYRHDR
jgi:hypothetical protein